MSTPELSTSTPTRKPWGLWLVQGYLLVMLVGAAAMGGASLQAFVTALIFAAGIVAIQVRAHWSFAVTIAVLSLLAVFAALGFFIRIDAQPDVAAARQLGRKVGRLVAFVFNLALPVYVAFGRRPRAYFGRVTSGP